MAYDFHITRREYWSDEDGPRISLAEWQDYVSTDPSISAAKTGGPDEFVLAVGSEPCPLTWVRIGEVRTPNPSPDAIRKLVEIADRLGARVLGDDDEIYGMDPTDPTVSFLR